MKISCDNCGAVYRIPEEKLTKDVSRATCKKCGSKLIIRRPNAGEDGYDDLRYGGQGVGDDDSVINHEERTVIAQVPELQKFDATPPLAGGVASQDELRGLLGGAASPPSTAASGSRPAPEPTPRAAAAVPDPAPRGAAAASASAARPASSAPAARSASPVTGPGASITAATSPAPPSGQVASSSPSTPPSSAMAATATTGTHKPANVVDIFSQTNARQPGAAVEFNHPTSKLPLVLLAIALVGVLLFIDKGLWGLTRVTAIGFFVALYGILAAFMSQLDLASTGRINPVKVFLVPAVVVLGVLAVLWQFQGASVAFLHPDVDIELYKEYIAFLPQAPEAEKQRKADLKDRIDLAVKDHKIGRRAPSRPAASDDMPSLDNLTRPGAGDVLPGIQAAGDPGQIAVGQMKGIETGWTPSNHRLVPPTGPTVADKRVSVDFDAEGIQQAIDKGRVDVCFATSAAGLALPGRVELKILMNPDGTARTAQFTARDLQSSKLEGCMQDKVKMIQFPSFDAPSAQWYTHTFIR